MAICGRNGIAGAAMIYIMGLGALDGLAAEPVSGVTADIALEPGAAFRDSTPLYSYGRFVLPPRVGNKAARPRFVSPLRLPMDGTADLLAETYLGPIFIGAGRADTRHRKAYFQVRRFIDRATRTEG